ncbi:MAG: hypothetical protein JNK04_02360 [Myxococcales bacterium]|nr:hypothetical protein [Myxococcales bacterium]
MRHALLALVLVVAGCDAGSHALAEREAPVEQAPAAPSLSASATACPSAIKPPGNVATQRVKVRSYTADRSSVRFFLEPKGAGKAPFEVIAGSQNLSNLLLSALDAQREVEVAVKQDSCVPEVVFVRSP